MAVVQVDCRESAEDRRLLWGLNGVLEARAMTPLLGRFRLDATWANAPTMLLSRMTTGG